MPTVRHPSSLADWLGLPVRFDVIQDYLEIQGYQMYAVEKWCSCFNIKYFYTHSL